MRRTDGGDWNGGKYRLSWWKEDREGEEEKEAAEGEQERANTVGGERWTEEAGMKRKRGGKGRIGEAEMKKNDKGQNNGGKEDQTRGNTTTRR